MIREQFVEIVEDRLKELQWSRSDLARAMSVSPQVVTNYLNGHSNAGPETMEKFLSALDLEPCLTVRRKALGRAS